MQTVQGSRVKSPLKGHELFRYRTGLEKTLPEKGGQKEYTPDGSWLQAKRVEKYHEERRTILSEPRIQRNCDIVHGKWNPERKLVEIEQEMGKFWMKMGFVDYKRKWLYPEEALFLMETNMLEVLLTDVPISIQEAYRLFLDDSFTTEMYQVYSYLCRIGYIVLRHQGRIDTTEYERKLKLDTYKTKKKRKKQKVGATKTEVKEQDISVSDITKIKDRTEEDIDLERPVKKVKLEEQDSYFTNESHNVSMESDWEEEKVNVRSSQSVVDLSPSLNICKTAETAPQSMCSEQENSCNNVDTGSDLKVYAEPQWDFDEVPFPDFSGSEPVQLRKPDLHLLPDNVVLHEERYVLNKPQEMDFCEPGYQNEEEAYVQRCREEMLGLNFSFEGQIKKPRNWSEFKKVETDLADLFPHLYGGQEVPLCSPQDAVSTSTILHKLQIVQEYKSQARSSTQPKVLPDFDVYAPNIKFRKSCPGLPDHRVRVVRFGDPVPDLRTISAMAAYLSDKVPVLWAVLDYGTISFYDVALTSLPVDISIG